MTFQTHQFPYGDDNYGLLMHCTEWITACVDAGDAGATEAALAETDGVLPTFLSLIIMVITQLALITKKVTTPAFWAQQPIAR